MAEVIDCPGCKRKLQVPDDVIGQRVQCPTCAVVFVAQPGTAAPQSSPAPPRRNDDMDFERPSSGRGRRIEDDDYFDDDQDEPRRRRRDMAPHRGDMVLVLGILGLLVCPLILGPMAWIMGNTDMAEMDAGRMDPSGRSNTSVGRVLGIVATCLMAIPVVLFCMFFGIAVIGAAAR